MAKRASREHADHGKRDHGNQQVWERRQDRMKTMANVPSTASATNSCLLIALAAERSTTSGSSPYLSRASTAPSRPPPMAGRCAGVAGRCLWSGHACERLGSSVSHFSRNRRPPLYRTCLSCVHRSPPSEKHKRRTSATLGPCGSRVVRVRVEVFARVIVSVVLLESMQLLNQLAFCSSHD